MRSTLPLKLDNIEGSLPSFRRDMTVSEHGSNEPTVSPNSPTSRIDRACDEFEKACRAGRPPMIEEFLMRAAADDRDRLLGELLEIELDYRQRSQSFVQAEDYQVRFPENAELVNTVFRRVVKARRLGDYELQEELGRGGMGVVFKARQIFLNQTVAVKILPHRYLDDAQAVSRFRREMQSIGALNHPNIVRAYNAGENGGVHFLVMEYVDGINLQRFVGIGPRAASGYPGGPVGLGAACEIIRQAALGLEHAHEHQLVHRDIKPANLMLSREGLVKILDMGLAKLHAEARGEGPGQDRLTLPGMTMGTVDFMAPEQWENSATADIRADIYSLGCTLFYLLAGKPPYGEPQYDTSRKKLMAHAVAPIPWLMENCDGAPEELDAVFQKMMAKNAPDRYATPAEVAEAIAEFADSEELAEVIAGLPPHEVCEATNNTGVEGAGADTPRRPDVGSAGSYPRRRSQSRWATRQRFRRNVTIGVAAGLTAVLCSLLAWSMMRPHDKARHADGTSKSSAMGMAKDAPITREALAAEIALLPGLDGGWWFDEMPWFTPFVRQAVAEKVLESKELAAVLGDRPQEYLDTNTTNARQWLWEVAVRCRGSLSPSQQKLMNQLKEYSDSHPAAHAAFSRPLEDALNQFNDGHRGGDWSVADLHTAAVLLQAGARRDATAEEIKTQYDRALKAYAAELKHGNSTYALCEFDSAICLQSLPPDGNDARRRIDEVLGTNDLPMPFHVSLLVDRGRLAAESANPGEYEEHRFTYAKRLLDGYRAVPPNHPLGAYIAESYAETLMDQWKVDEAIKQIQAAYHIRLTNKDENNPQTTIYIFEDRRASGLAARYRGSIDSARRTGKSLVVDLTGLIDEAERGHRSGKKPIDVRLLGEQLALALEAWADCELYGGAGGDGKVNLTLAAENYGQARERTVAPEEAVVFSCKRAIACALNGKLKDAQDDLTAAHEKLKQLPPASVQMRTGLAKQLAEAVLAVTGPTPADGRKLLRAFLDQFKLNPVARDSNREEIVEMQLFAAELLLNSDLDGEPKTARKDLKYLDTLLAVFRGRREMRPYLRRYYELAIAAYGKADPSKVDLLQIAHYVLDSRMAQPQSAPSSKTTLVLFSFSAKENFALFLPQDGRPGKRFELGITRDQIKAAKGKPLHLNDELVALIKGESAAGRAVEVFWDDTASRTSEDPDALTSGDWPFDGQLELPKLR
jgi:serine/threonine protein kinase